MNPKTTKPIAAVKKSPGRPKDAGKREVIVNVASKMFMQNGYALTSMDAIAKKADVSKLTIYSNFKNKDELFKEVVSQRCSKLGNPESYMEMAKMPVKQALNKIGLDYCKLVFTPDSLRLHSIMQAESTRHPQVVKIFFEAGPKRVRESFALLLEQWNKDKKLKIPNTAKATEQFYSLLKGELYMKIILLRAAMPKDAELKEHVGLTVDFFLAAYSPQKLKQ